MKNVSQEDFVHLHVKTPYSFYEGAARFQQLTDTVHQLNQKYLGFTDRNRVAGLVSAYKAANESGIKPVLGLQLDDPADSRCYMLFWAKNLEGYGELCRISSDRMLRPEFTLKGAIESLGNGLIAATSEVDLLEHLRQHLPPGCVYGELTLPNNDRDRKHARQTYDFCRKAKIPMVVTGSVAYDKPERRPLYNMLRAIGERQVLRRTINRETEVLARPLDDEGELLRKFSSLPEALLNTRLIAEQCEVDLQLGKLKFPKLDLESGKSTFEELRTRTELGLRRRYGDNPSVEARQRLAYELGVIDHLGFTSYFLIVHNIAKGAWKHGVRTLGRGSAANSLVSYCLELTDICPLRYDLYFERFLNPERTSPPDIDLDFSWRDRDEILKGIYEDYGHERVAMISTHVTFRARAAIREAALCHGIPNEEITHITRRVPFFSRAESIEQMVEEAPECRDLPLNREPWATITREANHLLGLPRHLSIHAGGVVISPGLMTSWSGLEMAAKGFMVTQYDMYGIEDLGLVKIDILSQRALGVLKDSVINVKKNSGFEAPVNDVESLFKDKNIWNNIRTGDTMGVFYVESPGMQSLLKKLDCDHYELLVAASSVIRPGVSESGMMQQFIERVRNPELATYLHPKMKDMLGETHGVMIYQEDVIKVAHHVAGMPLGKADSLRRAMSGKYRSHDEMEKVHKTFIDGCLINKVDPDTAQEIWRQVASFAGYSFCKAHSASFAVLSVQVAYMRTYFPAEFMAAVLANGGGFYSQAAYVEEARRMGLNVHLPHVNTSELEHSGKDNSIYLGLKSISALRDDTPGRILQMRQEQGDYTGLGNFIERVQPTRDEAEALIHCGAFDGLASNRPTLLRNLRAGFRAMKSSPGPLAYGAEDFFATLGEARDWTPEEKYLAERKVLGFSPGPHPLALLDLPLRGSVPARDLEKHQGRTISMIGWAFAFKTILTRNKKDKMKFASLEDLTGTFEVTIFPKTYHQYASILHGPGPYRVTGRVESDQGVCTLIASHVEKLSSISKEDENRRPVKRTLKHNGPILRDIPDFTGSTANN